MQYKDDQYAPSLHVEEFDDSLLYCGTTSLVPKTILPNSSLFVPSLCQYLHLIQALIALSSLYISSACNISMLQIRLLVAGDSSQAARTHQKWLAQLALGALDITTLVPIQFVSYS